jgi:hypothetical protein
MWFSILKILEPAIDNKMSFHPENSRGSGDGLSLALGFRSLGIVCPSPVCDAGTFRVGVIVGVLDSRLRSSVLGAVGSTGFLSALVACLLPEYKRANQALEPTAIILPPSATSLAPLAHL